MRGDITFFSTTLLTGVSVGASVFTLVAISLERYFAICHPLRSRSWQTLSHSYKSIVLVWVIAFLVMIPIAIYQRLWPLRNGAHKCVEVWNSPEGEKAYTLFLDLVLLVFPLILMLLAYGLISWTLWKGMKLEINSTQEMKKLKHYSSMTDDEGDTDEDNRYGNGTTSGYRRNCAAAKRKLELRHHHHMRHSNTERSLIAKKRVIRMLFVVVLEFFICWTPLYVLQTWLVFDFPSARQRVSPLAMNFIHLLSYVSSCCNPITYCFMNKKFRQGFLSAFRCCGYRTRILRKPSDSIGLSQRTVVSSFRSHDVYVDSVIEKSTYD